MTDPYFKNINRITDKIRALCDQIDGAYELEAIVHVMRKIAEYGHGGAEYTIDRMRKEETDIQSANK